MSENETQTPATDKPAQNSQTQEVTLDLGNGNMLTKEQAIAMKTAKEGLETELKQTKETLGSAQSELEKMRSDHKTAVQGRIEAEAARDTAQATSKELNLKTQGWVSPEEHGKIKEERDLMILKNLSDRIEILATTYSVSKEQFNGKTVAQIDAMEEAFKLSGKAKPAAPKVDNPGGQGVQGTVWDTEHQKNVEQVERMFGKN